MTAPVKVSQSFMFTLITELPVDVKVPPEIVLLPAVISRSDAELSEVVIVTPPTAFWDPLIVMVIIELAEAVIVIPARTLECPLI